MVNGDTVEISKEAFEKYRAANSSAESPANAMNSNSVPSRWKLQATTTVITLPTSYGRFNEGGDYSTSVPVNFEHSIYSSQKDFVKAGIINQDYVDQFNSILKNAKGDLKSSDAVFMAALNKYAELKNSISSGNSPDKQTQIEQLENSLNWSVGTSLNSFAKEMTCINVVSYKLNSAKSIEDPQFGWAYLDGGNANDLFTVNNAFYKTATNIVFSAAKLIEKGIDYINNNPYDPNNSTDRSKLLAAMNNGTDDSDSSNLSLSTLTSVISTFRGFFTAPDQVVKSNADKLAADAPSKDIGEVYLGIKKRLELTSSLEGRR
jgi:hypothetical protein